MNMSKDEYKQTFQTSVVKLQSSANQPLHEWKHLNIVDLSAHLIYTLKQVRYYTLLHTHPGSHYHIHKLK